MLGMTCSEVMVLGRKKFETAWVYRIVLRLSLKGTGLDESQGGRYFGVSCGHNPSRMGQDHNGMALCSRMTDIS